MAFDVVPTRWDEADAGDLDLTTPLGACCHGSRLLGSESSFVLHGGGNTSVKARFDDIVGGTVDALYVKGSGWDLATIEPAGFAPLRLARLHELLTVSALSDPDMARELAAAKLDPNAPAPSVESLLHAFIPFDAVQHSHADVIIALTNTAEGEDNIRDVFGDEVVVVPYVMPGFDLARLASSLWERDFRDHMTGMVLMNHGLFTFGHTTEEAYQRHVDLILKAQRWITSRPDGVTPAAPSPLGPSEAPKVAALRRDISVAAGRPMITTQHRDQQVAAFVARNDLGTVATQGPLTPDHIIRTKRTPMIGTDVASYVAEYEQYFERNQHRARTPLTMLDPAPRVVLDPELGMITVGTSSGAASICEDIYRHTIDVITETEAKLGGYVALDEGHLFDTEYWDLEQAKLRRAGTPPSLSGQVAVVTGAASGIGQACARALAQRGAAIVALDIDPAVADENGVARGNPNASNYLGITVDVTDEAAVEAAIETAVERFGGIDLAVVAAGIFPTSELLSGLTPATWRKTMAVNVDAVSVLFRHLHRFLALSPASPSVVVIGSKNAPAPGPGAAAYSASKAALTQLARVAALEWAPDGIRVNVVHPDAVFDTGLWSDELIAERAAKYNMTPEEYKTRNLLGTEVSSRMVAEVTVALCGPAFAATTGAQIPIDGGSDRVI